MFVAFEPVRTFFNKLKRRFGNNCKVRLHNHAAGVVDEKIKFYLCNTKGKKIGQGSTLIKGIYNSFSIVKSINFSKYIEKNFKVSDNIVLKIDIEGYEYNLLEHLIETGNIKYINKIYCEWHTAKLIKTLGHKEEVIKRHNNLVFKLQELGFNLKGKNSKDEFSIVQRKIIKNKRNFLKERIIKDGNYNV